MGEHRRRWTIASVAAAAGLVVAGTVWGLGTGTDTASANGTDGQFCTANQITVVTNRGDQSVGASVAVRHGAIQVTARPGEACRFVSAPPATVQGADLRVVSDDHNTFDTVVTPSTPAWFPLTWPDEASPSAQRTPRSITLELPGTGEVVVPWNGGGVDALAGSDPITVGPPQPGHAIPANGG